MHVPVGGIVHVGRKVDDAVGPSFANGVSELFRQARLRGTHLCHIGFSAFGDIFWRTEGLVCIDWESDYHRHRQARRSRAASFVPRLYSPKLEMSRGRWKTLCFFWR